mgnify:CR=1 FL=1
MKTSNSGHKLDNVIDFFTGKPYTPLKDTRYIRLSPELDGLEMLYSNEASSDKLFSLKILAWGLRARDIRTWSLLSAQHCVDLCRRTLHKAGCRLRLDQVPWGSDAHNYGRYRSGTADCRAPYAAVPICTSARALQ